MTQPMMRSVQAVLAILAITAAGCRNAGDSSAPSGHAELQAGGLAWTVVQGTWRTDGDALVGSAGNVLTREELGDALIELDVEQNADDRPRILGIGVRITVPDLDTSKASGYGLNWLSDRTFVVMRGTSGQWTWLSGNGFQSSPALQPFKNHLAIRIQGAALSITANGQPVFTGTDATYAKGKINFWVESTLQTVRFSNIHVTKL